MEPLGSYPNSIYFAIVSYADDCNVYVRSRRAGVRVMASLTRRARGCALQRVVDELGEYQQVGARALAAEHEPRATPFSFSPSSAMPAHERHATVRIR